LVEAFLWLEIIFRCCVRHLRLHVVQRLWSIGTTSPTCTCWERAERREGRAYPVPRKYGCHLYAGRSYRSRSVGVYRSRVLLAHLQAGMCESPLPLPRGSPPGCPFRYRGGRTHSACPVSRAGCSGPSNGRRHRWRDGLPVEPTGTGGGALRRGRLAYRNGRQHETTRKAVQVLARTCMTQRIGQ
jgi:hypothetical protein